MNICICIGKNEMKYSISYVRLDAIEMQLTFEIGLLYDTFK